MSQPRFFLFTPSTINETTMLACAAAASKAGDCASIIVPPSTAAATVATLQNLGLAVLLRDAEARDMHHVKADGLHLSQADGLVDLRASLKSESLGIFVATSRHVAMEAAEAGADYVAFAQKSQIAGEPLLFWWQDIFEVPSVAFDPVGLEDLATLLPQKPDFIRPSDDMWQDAEVATKLISTLSKGMT